MDTGFWWGNHRERDNLEDTVVVWRIILKYTKKMGLELLIWTEVALGRGHVAGCHEHNSAHLRSKTKGDFLST